MFSPYELDGMRETQQDHMMDICIIKVFSRTYDSFGSEIAAYTGTTELVCGLDQRPGFERHDRTKTVVEYDATIRLPLGTSVDMKDRIEITKRFGEIVTGFVYEIAGPIQRGPSGIRILLKRMVT